MTAVLRCASVVRTELLEAPVERAEVSQAEAKVRRGSVWPSWMTTSTEGMVVETSPVT